MLFPALHWVKLQLRQIWGGFCVNWFCTFSCKVMHGKKKQRTWRLCNDSPGFVPLHSCSRLVSGRSSQASNLHTRAPSPALSKQAPMKGLENRKGNAKSAVIFFVTFKSNNRTFGNSSIFYIPLKPSESSTTYFVISAPPSSFGGSDVENKTITFFMTVSCATFCPVSVK